MLCVFGTAVGQNRDWLPDHAVLQYAGSIGLASIGVQYDVGGKHRMGVHYGYVPEELGGPLNIVAAKFVFGIVSVSLSESMIFKPLDAGVMVSYHFGSQFHSRWPQHRYPEGYYWWVTSLRPHLLTQTSFTYFPKVSGIQALTGFIELNTNELYLVNFAKNARSLSFFDIIKAGAGIRVRF